MGNHTSRNGTPWAGLWLCLSMVALLCFGSLVCMELYSSSTGQGHISAGGIAPLVPRPSTAGLSQDKHTPPVGVRDPAGHFLAQQMAPTILDPCASPTIGKPRAHVEDSGTSSLSGSEAADSCVVSISGCTHDSSADPDKGGRSKTFPNAPLLMSVAVILVCVFAAVAAGLYVSSFQAGLSAAERRSDPHSPAGDNSTRTPNRRRPHPSDVDDGDDDGVPWDGSSPDPSHPPRPDAPLLGSSREPLLGATDPTASTAEAAGRWPSLTRRWREMLFGAQEASPEAAGDGVWAEGGGGGGSAGLRLSSRSWAAFASRGPSSQAAMSRAVDVLAVCVEEPPVAGNGGTGEPPALAYRAADSPTSTQAPEPSVHEPDHAASCVGGAAGPRASTSPGSTYEEGASTSTDGHAASQGVEGQPLLSGRRDLPPLVRKGGPRAVTYYEPCQPVHAVTPTLAARPLAEAAVANLFSAVHDSVGGAQTERTADPKGVPAPREAGEALPAPPLLFNAGDAITALTTSAIAPVAGALALTDALAMLPKDCAVQISQPTLHAGDARGEHAHWGDGLKDAELAGSSDGGGLLGGAALPPREAVTADAPLYYHEPGALVDDLDPYACADMGLVQHTGTTPVFIFTGAATPEPARLTDSSPAPATEESPLPSPPPYLFEGRVVVPPAACAHTGGDPRPDVAAVDEANEDHHKSDLLGGAGASEGDSGDGEPCLLSSGVGGRPVSLSRQEHEELRLNRSWLVRLVDGIEDL